jgi:hypothetical protein
MNKLSKRKFSRPFVSWEQFWQETPFELDLSLSLSHFQSMFSDDKRLFESLKLYLYPSIVKIKLK